MLLPNTIEFNGRKKNNLHWYFCTERYTEVLHHVKTDEGLGWSLLEYIIKITSVHTNFIPIDLSALDPFHTQSLVGV